MEFRLLGPLEVWADGRRVELGGGRQRTLLAVLLVQANEVVSTDRLIHHLWGESPPATANKALQNFVSQLRRLLGDDRIVTRAPGYALTVDAEAIDARRFERLVADGRRLVIDEPHRASELLREALGLWRGPPLHEFAFEEFAQEEIARLEELALAALEHRIEADLALGRHAEVISELETAVKRHPLRERLRGQLMLALYRAHRQADALAVYQEGRRFLDDELGLEPGEELNRLERAILNHDPSLAVDSRRRPPTGTVTFLFTDVEGSTRLVRSLGDEYGVLLAQHHALLREAFAEHDGHEVDSQGDAFFFAFRRARDAVAAAVAAQRSLLAAEWPDEVVVRIRIGIHTGEPALADAGYHGLDVVRAARTSGTAHGGQILVSSATRDLVGDDAVPDVSFRDLGEHQLKDLEGRHRLFQVVAPDLPGSFPPPRTSPGPAALDIGGREDELAAAAGAAVGADAVMLRRLGRARTLAVVGAVLALAAALAAAAAVWLVGAGRDGTPAEATPSRVALVLPIQSAVDRADSNVDSLLGGLRLAERDYRLETETLTADEQDPTAPSVKRAAARLRSGEFDLVVVTGGVFVPAQELPSTRFVFLDRSVAGVAEFAGERIPNGTGFVFADDQTGYLVGYLSGLMEARDGPRLNGARVVSAIGGVAGIPAVTSLIEGFRKGAQRAMPGLTVLIDYSDDFLDQSKCEAIANRHIDAGADIVFAAAGTCSFGALAAAEIRGVWGVGVDLDRSYLGNHVLASAVKRWDQAVLFAIRSFVQGTLPAHRDVVLGLDDDAVGIAGISPSVPESIRRKVARAAAALRRGEGP